MILLEILALTKAKAQIAARVRIIHVSAAVYLMEKYEAEYDKDMAASLAAAVANMLFESSPGNQVGRDFLAANISLVDSELRKISADSKIRKIVSRQAYVRSKVMEYGAMIIHPKLQWAVKLGPTPEWILWISKMKELGFLRTDEQIDSDWPSSMDDLMRKAREFEMWVLSQPSSRGKA